MNSANSSVLNRLILLVLCLNLICLALLVFRAYQKPALVSEPASVKAPEGVVEGSHSTAPALNPTAPAPRRTGAPNGPRSIAPAEPGGPAAGQPTAAEEPALLAPAPSTPPAPL